MTTPAMRRKATTLGSVTAALLLSAALAPPSASADSTRTVNSYVVCNDGSLMYGFEIDYGSGWTSSALGASGYQVSASEKEVTFIIPSSATGIALDTYCDGGYVENSFYEGYGVAINPGTSTITANWTCEMENYYGQMERSCEISSLTGD
jgi:hypothetical protein